jgi:hypothetical protein
MNHDHATSSPASAHHDQASRQIDVDPISSHTLADADADAETESVIADADADADGDADDNGQSQSRSRSRSRRRRRRKSKKDRNPGLVKKLSFVTHLLKTLDLLVFAELSGLYYMEFVYVMKPPPV